MNQSKWIMLALSGDEKIFCVTVLNFKPLLCNQNKNNKIAKMTFLEELRDIQNCILGKSQELNSNLNYGLFVDLANLFLHRLKSYFNFPN